MAQYYEAHVTIAVEDNREHIKNVVENTRWKFSIIDGDINLGDGIKAYATRQFNSKHKSSQIEFLLHLEADILKSENIRVLRRKVELVLFDDRSSKVGACNGGCIECHLDDMQAAL